MIYFIAYYFAKIILKISISPTRHGLDNLPQNTGYILASNHVSNLDPVIIGSMQRVRYSYMGKKSLFNNKVLAFILKHLDVIPINRDKADRTALKEAIKRLKEGRPLVVFPEGTRGGKNRQKKVQPGIGFVARKSNVPIVPMYIRGSDLALPSGAKWIKRNHVDITIGKPLYYREENTYEEIAHDVLSKIYALGKSFEDSLQ